MDGHLIIDPPQSGDWNMAVDEALLAEVEETGIPVLRFYSWSEPTLSLGYFQQFSERSGHRSSARCSVVRRATGGGAILHDREITYSLTVADADPRFGAPGERYRRLHLAIVTALGEIGVSASRFADGGGKPLTPGTPFLCFQRRMEHDLIVAGYKVLGSAQRRSRRAVLQHGSLLCSASRFAPELPGFCDLTGKRIDTAAFTRQLAQFVGAGFGLAFQTTTLQAETRRKAEGSRTTRYGCPRWTEKR